MGTWLQKETNLPQEEAQGGAGAQADSTTGRGSRGRARRREKLVGRFVTSPSRKEGAVLRTNQKHMY
jgi:hypothetical protein